MLPLGPSSGALYPCTLVTLVFLLAPFASCAFCMTALTTVMYVHNYQALFGTSLDPFPKPNYQALFDTTSLDPETIMREEISSLALPPSYFAMQAAS